MTIDDADYSLVDLTWFWKLLQKSSNLVTVIILYFSGSFRFWCQLTL